MKMKMKMLIAFFLLSVCQLSMAQSTVEDKVETVKEVLESFNNVGLSIEYYSGDDSIASAKSGSEFGTGTSSVFALNLLNHTDDSHRSFYYGLGYAMVDGTDGPFYPNYSGDFAYLRLGVFIAGSVRVQFDYGASTSKMESSTNKTNYEKSSSTYLSVGADYCFDKLPFCLGAKYISLGLEEPIFNYNNYSGEEISGIKFGVSVAF